MSIKIAVRRGVIGMAAAAALVVGAALPASAAPSGYQTCSSTQQYGIQTRLAAVGSSGSTQTNHNYIGGTTAYHYGPGWKNSTRPGVSSGGWEAYVPAPASFLNVGATCGPRTV